MPPFTLTTNTPPLRPTWLRGVLLSALALVMTVYAYWPMFAAYPHTPEEDGRAVYLQYEIARASIFHDHELPLWNPFDCHGIPMWDHPESMVYSPLFLATLFTNTTVTFLVFNLVHIALGFVGMWLFCRGELKLTREATFAAAAIWAFAVAHTSQYAGEHQTLIGFVHAPLLVLLWRRAERSYDYAVGLGIGLALLVFEGATYPLPFTVLTLVLETVTRLSSLARLRRIVLGGLVVGAVAIGLSACRMLPLLAQMTSHVRPLGAESDHIGLKTLWTMFTLRSPDWRAHIPNQEYVFGEYIAYVGWLGVVLVVLGVIVGWAEYGWLTVWAAIVLALMLGHYGMLAPWTFLKGHVFPYKAMRVPARFRLVLLMCMASFVAIAIDRIPQRLRSFGLPPRIAGGVRVALLGAALIVAGDAVGLGQQILGFRFNGRAPVALPASPRFYYGGPGLSPDFIEMPRQNRAWLGCRNYEWQFGMAAPLWSGDVPQARVATGDAKILAESRTHNRFTIDVEATETSIIHFNSAHDPSWRTNFGTVLEHDKFLSVEVGPGKHRVRLRYWPRYLTLGFIISGLTVLFVIAFYSRKKLREPSA